MRTTLGHLTGAVTLALMAIVPTTATAADYNALGKTGYAAWRCSLWAEAAGKQDEFQRLFHLGYDSLRAFVEGFISGDATKENTRDVPVGILWNLTGGPSVDFRLGFIWAQILSDVWDDIPSKDTDPTGHKVVAASNYNAENCALVR